jgi:hypothetical protein
MSGELSGFFLFLELSGLQQFSLGDLDCEWDPKSIRSWLRLAWSLILTTFFVILGVWLISFASFDGIGNINALRFIALNFTRVGLMFVIATALIQSLVSIKSEKNIFLNGNQIVNLVRKAFGSEAFSYQKFRRFERHRLIALTVLLFAILGIASSEIKPSNNISDGLVSILPLVFLLLIAFKSLFYEHFVNYQLEIFCSLFDKIFPDETVSARVIQIDQEATTRRVTVTFSPIRKLQALNKVYNLIHENACLVNAGNGFVVLVMIFNFSVTIITNGYEWFLGMFIRLEARENFVEYALASISSTVLLFRLFKNCDQTKVLVTFCDFENKIKLLSIITSYRLNRWKTLHSKSFCFRLMTIQGSTKRCVKP